MTGCLHYISCIQQHSLTVNFEGNNSLWGGCRWEVKHIFEVHGGWHQLPLSTSFCLLQVWFHPHLQQQHHHQTFTCSIHIHKHDNIIKFSLTMRKYVMARNFLYLTISKWWHQLPLSPSFCSLQVRFPLTPAAAAAPPNFSHVQYIYINRTR